jgi:hypothetical protein
MLKVKEHYFLNIAMEQSGWFKPVCRRASQHGMQCAYDHQRRFLKMENRTLIPCTGVYIGLFLAGKRSHIERDGCATFFF